MAPKTYLFQPGKLVLKQGFLLTDENDNVVYDANPQKKHLIIDTQYEFFNHLTGEKTVHAVSKNVRTEPSADGSADTSSSRSSFKLDGENVWNYLRDIGVQIDTYERGGSLDMNYNVSLRGEPLALLEPVRPAGEIAMKRGFFYKMTTDEENLDLAFLVAFAIARTDQTFYG